MHIPTDPSIETMSDNGIISGTSNNVDQETIVNYCNDSIKEIDFLTEELKQSDNSSVNNTAAPPSSSSVSSSSTLNATANNINNLHHTVTHNSHTNNLQNNEHSQKCDPKNQFYVNDDSYTDDDDEDVDDVISSPSSFYTQSSQTSMNPQHLQNTLNNGLHNNIKPINQLSHEMSSTTASAHITNDSHDNVDGIVRHLDISQKNIVNGQNDDTFDLSSMLQSVSLTGKNDIKDGIFTVKLYNFFFRHIFTKQFSNKSSTILSVCTKCLARQCRNQH